MDGGRVGEVALLGVDVLVGGGRPQQVDVRRDVLRGDRIRC
jgi:hypothetical protein